MSNRFIGSIWILAGIVLLVVGYLYFLDYYRPSGIPCETTEITEVFNGTVQDPIRCSELPLQDWAYRHVL